MTLPFFIDGTATAQTIVGVIGCIAAGAFASLFLTKFGAFLLPKPKETRVADFLPFRRLREDSTTVECMEGTILRVFAVRGADITLVAPQEREAMLFARKQLLDNLADMNIVARFITIRERQPFEDPAQFENPVLADIARTWTASLSRVYTNKHYIVLSVRDYQNNVRDLDQASQSLTAILDMYAPRVMFETEKSDLTFSPFYLFSRLLNPVSKPTPRIGKIMAEELNSLLTVDTIHFTGERGVVKFFAGDKEKLCCIMGIRACGDFIDEQMSADLLALDIELNLLHNIQPLNKIKAMALLAQQKRMAMMTNFSPITAAQYDEVMSIIDSTGTDFQTICQYAMTIFLFGESREELEFGQQEVERICRSYGFAPVREGWASQASFFAQFPTYEVYPRTYRYLSRMAACSICLEKSAEGNPKSDWGDGPITVFKTVTSTCYQWQFHVSSEQNAVAHAVVIGPTGQGKTTILAFLAGMAMRHERLRVYFFDRHRGVEIFCKSIGGSYINFDGEEGSTTLNPFSAQDTPENRAFLRRWLRSITMVNDATSEKEIARAVTTAFEYLVPEDRILKNLYKSCFSPTGNMRRELYRWVNDQQYGRIFNSPSDNLDMTSKFIAFDFTHIFEDEALAPAVISYIMHRINTVASSTGDPSLIMIDETAPMLKHPMFKDQFIIGLQEGRKKRQAFLCAFQQPNIIDTLGLGEVVRGQCQTIIFFRNPQGLEEDYANWRLTPRERDFIFGRAFKELKYAVLVSRPAVGESVILNVGLGGLGPYLKLFSSGRKHVLLAEQLQKEFGKEGWIEKYLQVA